MSTKCYQVLEGKLTIRDPELEIFIEESWDLPYLPDWKNNCCDSVSIEQDPKRVFQKYKEKPHGEMLLLYSCGAIKGRCFYREGILHGPSLFYSPKGTLLSSTWFYQGRPVGEAKQFYANGSLYALLHYRNGLMHGSQTYFYEEGQIKTKMFYQEGKIDGIVELLWPSGQIKRECEFCLGLKQGKDVIYSSDGIVLDEGQFEQGIPVGVHRRRYENGELYQEKHYHTKQKISRFEWDPEGNLVYEGKYLDDVHFQETRWRWPQGDCQVKEGVWDGVRLTWK